MTALPARTGTGGITDAATTVGQQKTNIGDLRDYLAGLFGTDGTRATALATLKLLDPQLALNMKLVPSVGSSALTMTLKDKDGNDLSASNPAFISQRSATAGDGGFNLRTIAANVALVLSSGSKLGHEDGVAGDLYWYVLDKDANTQKLAVCGTYQGLSGRYSTTAEGGAGGADSGSVMYADEVLADKPGRLVAISRDTQTTAGTWAALPTTMQQAPFEPNVGAQVLTDGVTVSWNAAGVSVATLTIGGNRTMAAPTGLKAGGRYVLVITQDATGGRQVTWNAVFKNSAGSMPQPNPQPSAVTAFTFTSPDGTNLRLETNEAKVLLATASAAGASSIDFTKLVGFVRYEFELLNIYPSSGGGQTLQMQGSEDNGSTWLSGGSDNASLYERIGGSAFTSSGSVSTATIAINIIDAVQNTSGWGISGLVAARGFGGTSDKKIVNWLVGGLLADNYLWSSSGSGAIVASTAPINGVRFKFGSGNITGTIRVYGIRG